jgi:hypothetical protein
MEEAYSVVLTWVLYKLTRMSMHVTWGWSVGFVVLSIQIIWFQAWMFGSVLTAYEILRMFALLIAVVPVIAWIIGMFLNRSNPVFGIWGKHYSLTLIYIAMFVFDLLATVVIKLAFGFPFGYVLGWVYLVAVLAATYLLIRYVYWPFEKKQKSANESDAMERDYHETKHGWFSQKHMNYYFGFLLIDLTAIFAAFTIAKNYFQTFEQEIYISLLSLIPVIIVNICYRIWDPMPKTTFDTKRFQLSNPQEVDEEY